MLLRLDEFKNARIHVQAATDNIACKVKINTAKAICNRPVSLLISRLND